MAGTKKYRWDQGADGEIDFVYKLGSSAEDAIPVDLTNYTLRMDISVQGTDPAADRIWTFNSDDNAGTTPIDETGDTDNEATLGSEGQVHIIVPRALTLAGGVIYEKMTEEFQFTFNYDIFLRKPAGTQKKILKGTVTIDPSVTLWA